MPVVPSQASLLPSRVAPAVAHVTRIGAATLLATLASGSLELSAKAPGVTHCYKNVCHRVRTIEETRQLLGSTLVLTASHYDFPGVDRFNVGTYTSNGERFDAGDPGRVSSSDLPDGTELLLRNPENGRVSHVRVNDFGPFHSDRLLDVTRRVADDLGFAKRGVTELEATIISVPRTEDLTYRRNRPRLATAGRLGTLDEAAMPDLITRMIAERSPPGTPRIIVAAPLRQPPVPLSAAGTASSEVAASTTAAEASRTANLPQIALDVSAFVPTAGDAQAATSFAPPAASASLAAEPPAIAGDQSWFSPASTTATGLLADESTVGTRSPAADDEEDLAAMEAWSTQLAGTRNSPLTSTEMNRYAAVSTGHGATINPAAERAWRLPVTSHSILMLMMATLTSLLLLVALRPLQATAKAGSGKAGSGNAETGARRGRWVRWPSWTQDLPPAPATWLAPSTAPIATPAASKPQATTSPPPAPFASRQPFPQQQPAKPDQANVDILTGGPQTLRPHLLSQAQLRPTQLAPEQTTGSLIGAGFIIDGNLRSTGRIAIAGLVKGRIEAKTVEILPGGCVIGEIVAGLIDIAGTMKGQVAAETVQIRATATVEAAIACSTIGVEEGAQVEADVRRKR